MKHPLLSDREARALYEAWISSYSRVFLAAIKAGVPDEDAIDAGLQAVKIAYKAANLPKPPRQT